MDDVFQPAPARTGLTRRAVCALLLAARPVRPASVTAAGPLLAIIAAGTDAYSQAMAGICDGLASAVPLDSLDLAAVPQPDELRRAVSAKRPRAIIAIGPGAFAATAAGAGDTPVISTMVLRSDIDKNNAGKLPAQVVGEAVLDLDVATVCREWKQLVPGKTRLGVIRNPLKNTLSTAAIESQAAAAGCTAQIADCSRPEDLLKSFLSFKETVDFVWCIPDSSLYISATVRPLLIASLERRLPLVGFSESFARAGAIMGVYLDFADVGRQTAELVRKWIAGEPFQVAQAPRTARVAFNHRVARLMSVRSNPVAEADTRILVLK